MRKKGVEDGEDGVDGVWKRMDLVVWVEERDLGCVDDRGVDKGEGEVVVMCIVVRRDNVG